MHMLSIVIPAYNEQDRIGPTLVDLNRVLRGKPHEIIIVADGQDRTPQVVKSLKIPGTRILPFRDRMGKGGALRAGIEAAQGSHIVIFDADNAMAATELPRLLFALTVGADIAIGTRYADRSHASLSGARKLTAWLFNRWIRWLFGLKISDTQCGYKAFRADVARRLAQKTRQTGFVWDVEMLVLAKKAGYTVKEVPIRWSEKGGGDLARNTLKSVWGIFRDSVKLRLQLR
ncbi:glycosyltransferase [Candidatus Micrarchaeota archaeon]|nr:glycosyltransferase [Candidatus Micrarchaeota archaeon]